MSKTKQNAKVEDHISKLLEDMFNKKMQLVETELKTMVIKTSEEYFTRALQSALKDSIKPQPSNNHNDDLMQNMGLNDGQMVNSLLQGLGRCFSKF